MQISVAFFGSDDAGSQTHADKYADILRIAQAADALGFAAVWTPERHFQQVGQVFSSPPVLSAALAAVTQRIAIRAGSVVLPLHHPLRVVEDWAIVDNLSRGRIGLSVATGWHSTDFVLAPDHYPDRRERALQQIPLLRRLWAGEPLELPDGAGRKVSVRPQPTPYSADLPLWLTSSGNPESWRAAGRLGVGVLSGTLGQSRDELAEKIGIYREAFREYQNTDTQTPDHHDPDGQPRPPANPAHGTVSLMAHCFVGEDQADALARAGDPLRRYLAAHVAQSAANHDGTQAAALTPRQTERLTEFALRRHLAWGTLVGSAEDCRSALLDLRDLGCDEVAGLVDFGLGVDDVLAGLHRLDRLRKELD
ncbi:MAG TPA: MupA/Atu3671 family FMN-dependent luciferase-like monooxygenase [Actinocrinis sp.]|nr:MupA/Atu3671 family FMN-dependent luciferase-like monooxygenase [Actinocrinis sp.]